MPPKKINKVSNNKITKELRARQRFETINTYVSFNIPKRKLKSSEIRKVDRYYDEISELTSRPFHIYKPRNKDKFLPVAKFSNQNTRLKDLQVVFVPWIGPRPPRISVNKKGQVTFKSPHVDTTSIQFNGAQLIKNPDKYLNKVLDKAPKNVTFGI